MARARTLIDRVSAGNPLPEGTVSVGGGLVLLGLTAYVGFVVTGRALTAERYATWSVLWTLVFFAAPGVFFPLEQEISRAVSARRALGLGGGPVVKRAALLAAGLALLLVAISLAASGFLLDELFDGDEVLLIALLIALPAYALSHTCRGTLAGNGRFRSYGAALALEGTIRVVASVALAVVGVEVAGPFGLLIGFAPIVAMVFVLPRQRGVLDPGPEAPWAELSGALGWLLAGAVLSQAFVNASVPLVKVLAGEGETALAGHFQAGLIIARVPLFLFQAIQASLLPKLSGLAASGRLTDFRTGLKRLSLVVGGIAAAGALGGWAFGPWALTTAFGSEFGSLGHRDLGMLALSSGAFMLAMALSQALIALRCFARAAAGWAISIVVLAIGTALGNGLLWRVELGLVAGSAVAVLVMAVLVRGAVRQAPEATAEDLLAYESPLREIIEP